MGLCLYMFVCMSMHIHVCLKVVFLYYFYHKKGHLISTHRTVRQPESVVDERHLPCLSSLCGCVWVSVCSVCLPVFLFYVLPLLLAQHFRPLLLSINFLKFVYMPGVEGDHSSLSKDDVERETSICVDCDSLEVETFTYTDYKLQKVWWMKLILIILIC